MVGHISLATFPKIDEKIIVANLSETGALGMILTADVDGSGTVQAIIGRPETGFRMKRARTSTESCSCYILVRKKLYRNLPFILLMYNARNKSAKG